MRTPIGSIIYFLNSIVAILTSKEFKRRQLPIAVQYCTVMMSQLEFLQGFVDDLLDLGQLKSGDFTLTRAPFDMVEVLELIVGIFSPMAHDKNIEIRAQI